MTTFSFPAISSDSVELVAIGNTGQYVSPLTGAIKTRGRGGEHWCLRMTFRNRKGADSATLQAFFAKLNGQEHRFTVHDHSKIQRGALSGTPLIAGASQTGLTVNIDGAPNNITNWIRTGDHVGIGGRIRIATADANSNGSGAVVLAIWPALIVSPADNDPVVVSDPTSTFILSADEIGWTVRPGDFANFSFDALEDFLA